SLGRAPEGFLGIRCAGGHAEPCLVLAREGTEVVARDWSPETGAIGRERARWRQGMDPGALSPDGRPDAVGGDDIVLRDLETGRERRVRGSCQFVAWLPDNTVATNCENQASTDIMRVGADDRLERIASYPDGESMPWYRELAVAPDGKTVAATV